MIKTFFEWLRKRNLCSRCHQTLKRHGSIPGTFGDCQVTYTLIRNGQRKKQCLRFCLNCFRSEDTKKLMVRMAKGEDV